MTRRVQGGAVGRFALLAAVVLFACGGAGGGTREDGSAGSAAPPPSATTPDPATTPAPEAESPAAPSPAAPAVTVAFAAEEPVGLEGFASVSGAALDDVAMLYVVADWTGVGAEGAARVLLLAPGGTAYFDQRIPLAEGTTGLLSVRADGARRRLVFRLPVWGTVIESYRWTGSWQATVSLDGASTAGVAALALR